MRAASASCPPIDRGWCSRFTPQRAWPCRSSRSTGVRPQLRSRGSCGMPASPCWSSTRNELRWRRPPAPTCLSRSCRSQSWSACLRRTAARTSHPGSISSGKRRSSTPPGPAGGRRALASPTATSGSARSPPPSTSAITPMMSGWRRCRYSTSAGWPSSSAASSARFRWSSTSDFDPEAALAAIDDGATLLSVVPAMLQRMLDARGDAPWPPTPALRSSRWKRGAAPARRGVRVVAASPLPRRTD